MFPAFCQLPYFRGLPRSALVFLGLTLLLKYLKAIKRFEQSYSQLWSASFLGQFGKLHLYCIRDSVEHGESVDVFFLAPL